MWNKIKWAFLSRLQSDNNEQYLPFNVDSEELNKANLSEQTQELKALRKNQAHQPSDTDNISNL